MTNNNNMSQTLTNCAHNTGVDDFYFKVILVSCQWIGCYVETNAAVLLSIVAAEHRRATMQWTNKTMDLARKKH